MNDPNAAHGQMQRPQTNWIGAIINCMVFSLENFLHTDFGERYIAAKPVLAVIIMALFPALFSHCDPGPMYLFLLFFILIRIAGRLERVINRWRGRRPAHSLYTGRPILMRFIPFVGEVWIKRLEPLLVMPVGLFLAAGNPPLGIYVIISAFLLLLCTMSQADTIRHQSLDMNDQLIEQELAQEQFEKIRRY
jgi:hypothetical protein